MDDLISREQAIDALNDIASDLHKRQRYDEEYVASMCADKIEQLPSIQPKIGKWVEINKFSDCRYVKCDQCEAIQVFYYGKRNTNFCPNCGAKMGDEDE